MATGDGFKASVYNTGMVGNSTLAAADLDIQSVTDTGGAAKNRIKHLAAALHIFSREKEIHKPDAIRRARIKGMINGNPPYDQYRLEELGLGYMINVNFQEMRAILDAKAAAHYELFFEVPTLIELKQIFGKDPNDMVADYGQIIAEEFTKMCFDWSGFLPFMDKTRRESDAFGLGVGGFRDKFDWRPRAFNSGSFLTTKHAEMDIEKVPYAFLRDPTQVGEIFRMALDNPEVASKDGWNIKQVRRLMKKVFSKQATGDDTTDKYQTSMWESIEQQIRNNDFIEYERVQFEYIDLCHLLVREIDDGKISHYIFDEGAEQGDDFLFVADRTYDNMSQALWWLPYNNGDGYLHSVRGLASMVEHHCDLSNRYLGRVFDAGFTSSSLLLQPNGPVDMSQLQLIRMGVITIIPHQVKAIQSSFQPNVGQLIQLRDLSSSIMRNNTGIYRQNPELMAEQQSQKTAYQVSQEVAREARAEKSNIAYDYDQVEKLYREMFRRVTNRDYLESSIDRPGLKEAQKFVLRCVNRGVPYELLTTPDAFDVYATRAMGLGSWGVKLDLSNQVLNMQGMLDEQGRINAIRNWLAVRVGYRNVDQYKPLQNRDSIPSNETSIATLENNDMLEGSAVPVGADQGHVIHINTHIQPALGLIRTFQDTQGQGVRVEKTIPYLQQLLPHVQSHIQYLSVDPTRADYIKQVMEVLKMLSDFAQQLMKQQKNIDQQNQAQEEFNQQQLQQAQDILQNHDAAVKLAEIEKKFQVEMTKQNSLNQMRAKKTADQMDIRRMQAAEDLRMRQEKQNSDISLKQREVEAKIALEQRKQAGKQRE